MAAKHYRAKPVQIEAVEWTGDITELAAFVGHADYTHRADDNALDIHTTEGVMAANVGDFIIRDVRGKFYPCDPTVFHHKYEETSIVHPEYPRAEVSRG